MEFITIEIRPRLQCCNVFVCLLDDNEIGKIQVKLNKDFITLKVGERVYNLSLTIRIIPTSLSCLRVAGSWVSFRIQTSPSDSVYGSFITEIIGTPDLDNKASCLSLNSKELPPKDTDIVFTCSCCENSITGTVNLKKVLPLPNNDCDPSDFFCCSHNGDDYSKLLEPRESDYLYGSHYAISNRAIFIEKLKINGESVVCNRCLTVIGEPNSAYSLKIWNYCMEYIPVNDSSATSRKLSNPLVDFNAAVKNCCSDGFTPDRILLEANESGATHYLLLKPMEWSLNVLIEPHEIQDTKDVSLSSRKVVKVLYDYGVAKSSLRNNYTDAKHVKIGLKSMLAGVNRLLLSSKRIPPVYRSSDEYHIGYMSLDISDKI